MKRKRSKQISEEHKTEYWFNTKTMSVEVGMQALALYRIGPFETREDAENAFEILKSRSETWSEEDEQDKD
ncbi:MAG: hypothetical protein RLZZ503_620 [Actinomycetota bacterium]